jgi:hypothetical protein
MRLGRALSVSFFLMENNGVVKILNFHLNRPHVDTRTGMRLRLWTMPPRASE